MSLSSNSHVILVAVIVRNGEYRVFVIETYFFKKVILPLLQLFREHFGVD